MVPLFFNVLITIFYSYVCDHIKEGTFATCYVSFGASLGEFWSFDMIVKNITLTIVFNHLIKHILKCFQCKVSHQPITFSTVMFSVLYYKNHLPFEMEAITMCSNMDSL